jgi:cysteine desulfurase
MGIYLDNAATTYMDPRVRKEMEKYFEKEFGNPNSFHEMGLRARKAVEKSREKVAKILNARPEEIVFTGSGTESINLAIKGVARANRDKGKHIITSKIEHHAVLDTCGYLEKYEGFKVTYLDVDKYGLVNPKDLEKSIRKDTILITIMYANNEIGTIQPIGEIGKIARKRNIYFHTDACQAGGYLDINVKKLNVDLLTLNGSKIYGPKGTGILYIRSGTRIHPIIHGGGQEFGLRSGTENVPGIVGFAKALEIAQRERRKESKRLIKLRDKLIKGITTKIPKSFLNGHPTKRLPNNVNVSILDIEGEALLLYLNRNGIYASTGSACTSKSLDPSHVITAIGLPYEAAHGSIRFSLGRKTKEKDIDRVLDVLPRIVEKLRSMSPVRLDVRDFEG